MARYYRLLKNFKTFSCKFDDPHVFSHSGVKVTGFSLIRSLAVTTSNSDKLLQSGFYFWVLRLRLDKKITFRLQHRKFPSKIKCNKPILNRAIKSFPLQLFD